MKQIKQVRILMLLMITGLLLSGLTVFPVETELNFLLSVLPQHSLVHDYISKLLESYKSVQNDFPQLLYGFDWLGFAHIILAILFIGPYKDPVKNIWVVEFGLLSCLLIFPLAFIAGHYRQIPVYWQLIDCSFGIVAGIILWIARIKIKNIISKNSKLKNGNIYSDRSI